ncbi:MAG: GGDEF domain-containing protein [Bacteroidales bacterium]|nr:GGDEF domain-containing protein [Clostridium sp.]MCM1202876.1 GGDEF domain-containing protein [Bacteroidales bacterium]
MRKRKNIALFVAMIENEFSYAICEGALMGAKEIDANLFILPSGIIDAKYDDVDANCYRYQYNTLFSCVAPQSFDAIIIEYGTVTSFLNDEQKTEMLAQMGDIPIILIAGQHEGYSSVCVDNKAGLNEAILHMIREHHCTKIGFVSGPKTSQDALERLDVFKETMLSEGLSADEDWIVYGNFSEFSEPVVEDLITRHPDIEAIVFANDQMAVGGYNAMKKLKLEPGKDILVTGFDNSPMAMLLEPHLTTVKADTKELAYLSVLECLNVIDGKQVNKQVKSRLIVRESCGCGDIEISERSDADVVDLTDNTFIKNLANATFDKCFNNYFESSQTLHMKRLVEEYFQYYFHLVDANGVLQLEQEEFVREYFKFSEVYSAGYIDLNMFLSVSYMLYGYVSEKILSEDSRLELMKEMLAVNEEFMTYLTKQMMVTDEKVKVFEIVLTNITRDMMQFSSSEKKKYASVINKLQKMDFPSGYILTYGEGITHRSGDEWECPENLYVKAYHNRDEVYLFDGKEKQVELASLFSSELMPDDRRYDMLVMPLFSGEKQYGLLITESELEYFRYASQIACQVSVSMEVIDILKKQNAIKQELEKNLARMEESNRVLDAMSHSDPLTGIANRRGFLDTVKQIMEDENNYGRKAVAVYADMDNLKIVNDEFGHDEGDYSLKTIAAALSESFRQSDVVARMGGDEFAAFAIVSQDNFAETLKQRVHGILAKMNENDKPYYVNISIGTFEFIIEEDSNLDHILNAADTDLYREKKNKKKVVYKNG